VQRPDGALGFFNRVPRTGEVKKSKTRNVLFSGENLEREREEEKNMEEEKGKEGLEATGLKDEGRRDFLRTSMYAAYATPVIMAMLVNKASAAKSWNSGYGEITGPATPKPPDGGTVGPNPGVGVNNNPTP
jgi:hypothetical protein